jgi:DNA polymerase III gamma/tau subunit
MFIAKNEGIELGEDGASLIAKTAQGGMRDAISLMELCAGSHKLIDANLVNEILGTNPYDKMCDIAKNIAEKKYDKLFDMINEIVVSSKDLLVFFSDLTAFYRDMMVQNSCNATEYLDLIPQEYALLEQTAKLFNMATLLYHSRLSYCTSRLLLYTADQLRNDLGHVTHNAVMCDVENRSCLIRIDGNDTVRGLHTRGKLYGARYTKADDQLRLYRSARKSDLMLCIIYIGFNHRS